MSQIGNTKWDPFDFRFSIGMGCAMVTHVPLPLRLEQKIRLTEDQATRLERVVKKRGQTRQAFMLAGVLRAIEEAEAEIRIGREDRRMRRESRDARRTAEEPRALASATPQGGDPSRRPNRLPSRARPSRLLSTAAMAVVATAAAGTSSRGSRHT